MARSGVAFAVVAFDVRRRHGGSGGWIAVRVGERSSFSGAGVAVVGGRFDFVSSDGLAFRGQGPVSVFGRVVRCDWELRVLFGAGDIISLSILGLATIAGLAGWFAVGEEKG